MLGKILTAQKSSFKVLTKNSCFFCGNDSNLYNVSTFQLDKETRQCVKILEDNGLLAKLSKNDLIALDAIYHRNCLRTLYKKAFQA